MTDELTVDERAIALLRRENVALGAMLSMREDERDHAIRQRESTIESGIVRHLKLRIERDEARASRGEAEATIAELRRERDGWELGAAERARDDAAILEGRQHQLKAMCRERDEARSERDSAQSSECEVRDLRGKLAAVVAELGDIATRRKAALRGEDAARADMAVALAGVVAERDAALLKLVLAESTIEGGRAAAAEERRRLSDVADVCTEQVLLADATIDELRRERDEAQAKLEAVRARVQSAGALWVTYEVADRETAAEVAAAYALAEAFGAMSGELLGAHAEPRAHVDAIAAGPPPISASWEGRIRKLEAAERQRACADDGHASHRWEQDPSTGWLLCLRCGEEKSP